MLEVACKAPRGRGRKGGTARSQAHFSDLTDSDATTSDCVTKRLFTIQNIKRMMMQLEASENQNKPSSASVHSGITANSSGSKEDRRSNTGYCVFLVGNLVTWRNKKRNVVSRSSFEAE